MSKFTFSTFLSIMVAFAIGIGFTEGLVSFAEKTKLLAMSNKEVPTLAAVEEVIPVEEIAVAKGSDDNAVLPLSEYNVTGIPKGLKADAYLIADLSTGEVIVEKNSGTVFPIASISKLMTAVVAREKLPLQQEVVVTKSALATYGPSGGLFTGEKVRMSDLQYPLLLESSNDVALLISEQMPEGQFASQMNDKAFELGMRDTTFEEASGLSKNNISTASDLFLLGQYIYRNRPEILDITRIKEFALLKHSWTNHNYMLRFDTFIGGKNGYTDEALRTSLSLFEMPIQKGEGKEIRPLAIIVLHTTVREDDMVKLLDFVKKSVELQD